VDDALIGRNDLEVAERGLSPLEELVPLLVALELELRVDGHRVPRAERVDLYRVVDDQLHGLERVDLLRVTPELLHRVAHGRQVDYRRDPGEVLQEHAGRGERDLARRRGGDVHAGEGLDVFGADGHAVFRAKEVLEEDLQRKREALGLRELCVDGAETEVRVRSRADGQAGLGGEGIGHGEEEN
jgi:hypothetical protein